MSLSTFARMMARHSKRVTPLSVPKALFSSVNSKFNLPPIPVDGIFRRPEIVNFNRPVSNSVFEDI